MFWLKIAGYIFAIENRYEYVHRICREYEVSYVAGESSAFAVIAASDAEIAFENQDGRHWTPAYLEALAIYRKICERLLEEDLILFHSSALAIDGKAYLFTAPSGTGKSTHARLWRERFGERVTMINDDKPLVRIGQEETRVYGTPYGGKDNLQTNTSAPVAGIVILHQAAENTIRRCTQREAFPLLLNQTYRRRDSAGLIRTLDLVKQMAKLPVWELGCTISQEAVTLVYQSVHTCRDQRLS